VASENIPGLVAQQLVGLDIDPLVFLLSVNVLLLLLGCLLDATTLILVIIPLFLPACRELGIDLVHFGVVAVVNCMIGLITPPYGILLFVINGVTGHPAGEIIREIWPFTPPRAGSWAKPVRRQSRARRRRPRTPRPPAG
jgi:TRAP-type transport system large permease protein